MAGQLRWRSQRTFDQNGYRHRLNPYPLGFGDDEDKLVVITDGAKRMKLIAFWRDEIPSDAKEVVAGNPRIADAFEVTCGLPRETEWVQSEQSVVCAGYGAFVVNNILSGTKATGDKVVDVLAIGPLIDSPQGVERLRWNTTDNCWESVWSRGDISSSSMIPSVSTASEMVFVNGLQSVSNDRPWDRPWADRYRRACPCCFPTDSVPTSGADPRNC